MASENVFHTTDQNFERDILKSTKPILVDFWATWCAPCRALAPVVDEVANQFKDTIGVYKVDIDSNPESPAKFGVRGIPTVILFKDGKVVDQVVGAVPKSTLEGLIKKAL
ncbi:MAG: thioredoxin [Deltaproteobacteria bacterium]|nr:MAG: thioredoxin [Deltaproteobacteria bacterium]